jgi:hypothetical protein
MQRFKYRLVIALSLLSALFAPNSANADHKRFLLPKSQIRVFDHKNWMPPETRKSMIKPQLDRLTKEGKALHVNAGEGGSLAKLREQHPILKGMDNDMIRVVNAHDPAVQEFLKAVGHQVPMFALKVTSANGHPYFGAFRDKAPSESAPFTWFYETSIGGGFKVHQGNPIMRKHALDKAPSKSKNFVLFGWIAPSEVTKPIGNTQETWYSWMGHLPNEASASAREKGGWACTEYATNLANMAGRLRPNDPNNPFKKVWGVPSWEANRSQKKDWRDVGSAAFMHKAGAPDFALVLQANDANQKMLEQVTIPGVSPLKVEGLTVPPQAN